MDRAEGGSSFQRYLAAKKALDDRSLNHTVWRAFCESCAPGTPERPLRVIEVGAGIGTMIERLLERTALGRATYLALDSEPDHAVQAAVRLEAWAGRHGGEWDSVDARHWRLATADSSLDIHWTTATLFDSRLILPPADVVLAHAFLDLVDLERALPRMLSPLVAGGLFYFTLNFDGLTAFLPEVDLDRTILRAYHASMDRRRDEGRPSGDSRTGRRLLVALPRHGAEIIAAGASDWVIWPRRGGYTEGEAEVLSAVLDMVEGTLATDPAIPPDDLASWSASRRFQLRAGELVLIAHQLDVLGRRR